MKLTRKQSDSSILFFGIFALTIFAQLMLFHWQCFHTILISSLWKAPSAFLLFYLPKIGITLFFASFVFLFRRRWWTVVISLIFATWSLSELVYIRANHVPLDAYSITMIGNMEGFWSSVPLYIEPLDYGLFGISLILAIAVFLLKNGIRKPLPFAIVCCLGIILNVSICISVWLKYEKEQTEMLASFESEDAILPPGAEGYHLHFFISPFSIAMERLLYSNSPRYLYDYSSLHSFVYCCKCLFVHVEGNAKLNSISDELFNVDSSTSMPRTKLIVCLVESFESWALRPDIMPNMWRLKESSHAYFNPSILSQTRRGTSADGQMIVETGLLPISDGAVCFRYQDNVFPSLSKLYNHGESCGLFPHPLDVWNQEKMSKAYGIEDNYICSGIDTELFSKACELFQNYESVLFITSSTHSPFKKVCDKSTLSFPEDMPSYMRDYLKSFNYFDESIGFFVDKVINDEAFAKATIVITGDHTTFQDEKRNQFKDYCISNNLDFKVENATCPLIIVSPEIHTNIQAESGNLAYQMDIFPTILHILGCEGYCWKGLGVNLLDEQSVSNRKLTEKEAYDLSDAIISSNYFLKFEENLRPCEYCDRDSISDHHI